MAAMRVLLVEDDPSLGETLQAWLQLADRQLVELEKQKAELDASIADLRALRETAVQEMDRLVE